MEASTPNTPDARAILDAQIREVFGRTVFSHKAHEKCADEFLAKHHFLKTTQIVLSSITTGSLIVAILGKSAAATISGTIISTIVLCLSTYTKDYDFGKIAQQHSDTAHKLWAVREEYFSLLTDIRSGAVDVKQIQQRRDLLQQHLEKIYANAPRTTKKSYKAAQDALHLHEELTFKENEVNTFLPKEIQKYPAPHSVHAVDAILAGPNAPANDGN